MVVVVVAAEITTRPRLCAPNIFLIFVNPCQQLDVSSSRAPLMKMQPSFHLHIGHTICLWCPNIAEMQVRQSVQSGDVCGGHAGLERGPGGWRLGSGVADVHGHICVKGRRWMEMGEGCLDPAQPTQ